MFKDDHDKNNERCVISECSGECGRSKSYSATNSVRKFKENVEQIVGPIIVNDTLGTTRPSKSCDERYGVDNTKRFEGLYDGIERSTGPKKGWHSCKCKGTDENDCDNSMYSSWTGYFKAGVADQLGTLNSF
jgi:hypothetical protein